MSIETEKKNIYKIIILTAGMVILLISIGYIINYIINNDNKNSQTNMDDGIIIKNNQKNNYTYKLFSNNYFQINSENEKNSCIPRDTYINWYKLRKYLKVGLKSFPKFISGSNLNVKRCLYYLSCCEQLDDFCTVLTKKYVKKEGNLTIGQKNVGYYELSVVEDLDCYCTNDEHLKDNNHPWKMPAFKNKKVFYLYNLTGKYIY